ncbi:MAG: DNA-protecting protein DprA, partial [Patescibacteria group bacterium]|nr:DNA-protecting protein DprA [Patescibacteria group bacterium]
PGPIYVPESRGPNNLIKMGGRLVSDARDILEDLNLDSQNTGTENQNLFGDSPTETQLLKILRREPLTIDELIKLSGLSPAETSSALTFLEMKGKIRNLGGQQYALSR